MARSSSEVFLCDPRLDCFYRRGSLKKSDIDYVVEAVQGLFRLKNVFITRDDSLERYSSLSASTVEAVCRTGKVVLTDEHQNVFTCVIEAHDSPSSNTTLHNQVVIVVNEPLVVNENFEGRLFGALKDLVLRLMPDFCYICDIGVSDYRYGKGRAGLSNGLRDLYWVNVFGPPFVELIGEDKLLELSSNCEIEKLAESEILVRLRGCDVARDEVERIKSEIGQDYFIQGIKTPDASVSSGGPLSLVKHLWSLGQGKAPLERAIAVPHF
jgi:hypothetical protein